MNLRERKWMDNIACRLENRSEAYSVNKHMAEQIPDIPTYTQDQGVQNFCCVAIRIPAA